MAEYTETLLFKSTIRPNIDIKPVNDSLRKLKTNIGEVEGAAKDLSGELSVIASAMYDTARVMGNMVDEVAKKVPSLTDALQKANQTFDELERRRRGLAQITKEEHQVLLDQIESIKSSNRYLSDKTAMMRGSIGVLEDNLRVTEEQNKDLKLQIDILNNHEKALQREIDRLGQYSHVHGKSVDDAKSAQKELAKVFLGVRRIMDQNTDAIIRSGERAGTSTKIGLERMGIAWRGLSGDLQESGILISDHVDKIKSAIAEIAREIGVTRGQQGKELEEFVKGWAWVFRELVGGSIIPELIEAMDYWLVERFGKIVDAHANYVESIGTFQGLQNTSPKALQKLYEDLILIVEKNAPKFGKTVQEHERLLLASLHELVKDFWVREDEYLRAYRDKVKHWSKGMTLADVMRRIEQEGLTVADVVREVDRATTTSMDHVKNAVSSASDSISKSMTKISNNVSSGITKTVTGAVNSIKQIPDQVEASILNRLMQRFMRLPTQIAVPTAQLVRSMSQLGTSMMDGLRVTLTQGGRGWDDVISNFTEGLKGTISSAGKIGIEAGKLLMRSMSDKISELGSSVAENIERQFKYRITGTFDAINVFLSKNERMRRAYDRALFYGLTDRAKKIRDEMTQLGFDLNTSRQKLDYTMRRLDYSVRDSLKNVGLAFSNLTGQGITFRDKMAGLSISFGHLGQSLGIFSDKAENLDKKFNKAVMRMSRTLGSAKPPMVEYDNNMLRLARSVDVFAEHMKTSGQLIVKQVEKERRLTEQRRDLIGDFVQGFQRLEELKLAGALPEDIERVEKAVERAEIRLVSLGGMAPELFNDWADAAKKLTPRFLELTNQAETMMQNIPKPMQMFNKAIEQIDTNSLHFKTTLEATGKVSRDRLSDIVTLFQRAMQHMTALRKIGALDDPAYKKYWDDQIRNLLQEAEMFTLLAQRAIVLENAKERLKKVTEGVAKGTKKLTSALIDHIPIIGKANKLTKEQREELDRTASSSQSAFYALTAGLSEIDPVIGEVVRGVSDMGQVFGDTMDGMRQAAAVGSASIAKSFTIIKIAAAGLSAVLFGAMFSTGKLAADINTLGITMRVVARNAGYSVPQMQMWERVLNETGISVRRARDALIQFMRARLPTSWIDPFTQATYTIRDLARAAQNMAVAVGEDSSETFMRFIDFVQTGNSQLLNQIGIMKNASQMLEEYAKATGKAVKQLSVREQYEALISGLMREAAKVEGVYEDAMKSAGKQLTSMRRYWEDLRYEWGKHFEPILALIVFNLNELLKILRDIPEETKATIATITTLVASITGLLAAIAILGPKIKAIFSVVLPIINLLTGRFGLLFLAIGAAASVLTKLFLDIESSKPGIAGIIDRIEKIKEGAAGMFNVIRPMMDQLSGFFEMISRHLKVIWWRITVFVDRIQARITELLEREDVKRTLDRIKKVVNDTFGVIWRVVDLGLSMIEDLFNQDWDKFFNKLKTIGMYILAWMLEFFNEVVKRALDWGWQFIQSFVGGLLAAAKIAIPRALTWIGKLISGFLEGHSPPKIGPLSNVNLWGQNLIDTFNRSIRMGRVIFDEDMFEGLSSLTAKANVWGDNIVDVFAMSIVGRAQKAIAPAMDVVGNLIARFLAGHSPPEAGPLTEIRDWGRNAFETFLAAFSMADFSILDRALDLIRSRIQTFVEDMEDKGEFIANTMMEVREAIAGAIVSATEAGGPLDLSAAEEIIQNALGVFTGDIADVMEAMFEAVKAEEYVKALNKKIEDLNKKIESEIESRIEAMGLIADEALMNELQRQMEEANTQISRAQRRIERIRSGSEKYGANVITWEEINAQAQLEMAEQRRDQIQTQIEKQEAVQREIERIRSEVQAQYKEELESAQEELKKAEETAKEAAERAEFLSKLLEERMAAEEELANAARNVKEATEKVAKDIGETIEEAIDKIGEGIDSIFENLFREEAFPEVEWPEPPDFSEIFQGWMDELFGAGGFFDLQGMTLAEWLKARIEQIWGDFKTQTGVGRWLEDIGITGVIEGLVVKLGDALTALGDGARWAWKNLDELTPILAGVGAAILVLASPAIIKAASTGLLLLAVRLSEIFGVGGILSGIGAAIAAINWPLVLLAALVGGLVWALVKFGPQLKETIEQLWFIIKYYVGEAIDSVRQWFEDIGVNFGKIGEWFSTAGENIGNAIGSVWEEIQRVLQVIGEGLWNVFVQPFIDIYNALFVNSWIPDIFNGIVDWISKLPGKLWEFFSEMVSNVLTKAEELFNAAVTAGENIFNGIVDIVTGLPTKIGEFLADIVTTISGKATEFFNGAVELGGQIFDGIKSGVDDVLDSIGDWLIGVANWLLDEDSGVLTSFWNSAKDVAMQIYHAIYDVLFNEETGIIAKIGGWLKDIGTFIVSAGAGVLEFFAGIGKTIGEKLVDAISGAVTTAGSAISGAVKGIWNNHLKGAFEGVLDKIRGGINAIIRILNNAAKAIGLGNWGPFPLDEIPEITLPSLQVGGLVTKDLTAMLHAGELVIPLSRIGEIFGGAVPPKQFIFSPEMNFYGVDPSQIRPAVQRAGYDWYEQLLSRPQ